MNLRRPSRRTSADSFTRWEETADRAKNLLERKAVWVVCGISWLYLVWTGFLTSRKLMWNDELYTYYIAMLPTVSEIWQAVMTGAEQIPPTFHLLTRSVLQLLGVSPISIRVPEMLGFLVMMLCLFIFTARRTSAFFGFLAMLFPLVTDTHRYAYEARPYGIVLGLAGVALVSWQAAAEGTRRNLSLVILSVSLAAALANHYYAILLFFALGVGEITRSLSQKRLDLPVWIAFAIAAVAPLLLLGPLIQSAASYSSAFYRQVTVGQLSYFYRALLTPAEIPLGAALLVGLGYAMYGRAAPDPEPRRPIPVHEVAAAVAFVAVPVAAFVLALVVTKAFASRYAAPAVLGVSLLFAFAVYHLPRGRALIGTTFLVFACGGFMLVQYRALRTIVQESNDLFTSIGLLQAETGLRLPIVASEPHVFMSLAHYAPPAITNRLVYLGDPEASLRHLGHNSVDRGMIDLVGPWFGLPVRRYYSYVPAHPQFWVYGRVNWLSWIIRELQDADMRIELKGRLGEEYLLLITQPALIDSPARYDAPAAP